MKQILKIINKLTPRHDRLAHFYWGFIYMLIFVILGRLLSVTTLPIVVLVLCAIIGFVKEYYDYKLKRDFDWVDYFFTLLPCLIHLIFKII